MYKFDVSQYPIMFLTVSVPNTIRRSCGGSSRSSFNTDSNVSRASLSLRSAADCAAKFTSTSTSPACAARYLRRRRRQCRPPRKLQPSCGPRSGRQLRCPASHPGTVQEPRRHASTGRRHPPGFLLFSRLATVEDSHEEVRQLISVNGSPAVRLFVYKQAGANTVEVSDAVWKEVDRIHADYPNVKITSTSDTATFIRAAIANVKVSAVKGSILSIGVLLIFLRSLSSTFIIGIGIPISIMITFAAMYFNGFTLNTISFGGLALGVGMLVDNAIVILENIYRHREDGATPQAAAATGANEVAGAMTASTFTTLAVFLPLMFVSGVSAVTFKQLAYVVCFSQIISLIVALTTVPPLCARYLRSGANKRTPPRPIARLADAAGAWQERIAQKYGRVLRWALAHRKTVILGSLATFIHACS